MPGKRKRQPVRLTLWDQGGAACYDGELLSLRVPEAEILARSVEYFDDPAPCYIHRGAVVSRILDELTRAAPVGAKVRVDSLPDALRRALDDYPAAWLEIAP